MSIDHIDALEQRAEVAEMDVKWLKGLLTRVLNCEGRCPTRLLIDISKALNTEKGASDGYPRRTARDVAAD